MCDVSPPSRPPCASRRPAVNKPRRDAERSARAERDTRSTRARRHTDTGPRTLQLTFSRRDSFAASIRYEIIAPRNFLWHGKIVTRVLVTLCSCRIRIWWADMNCAYYQQHGAPHPAPHNVNNNYFNEVNILLFYNYYLHEGKWKKKQYGQGFIASFLAFLNLANKSWSTILFIL